LFTAFVAATLAHAASRESVTVPQPAQAKAPQLAV
jgi:hypothetical protein